MIGDGDYLMGVNALWTAAHMDIPVMIVVADNRSYFNDEMHQERVAQMRGRPAQNRWIGQRIDDPRVDLGRNGARPGIRRGGAGIDRRSLGESLKTGAEIVAKAGVISSIRWLSPAMPKAVRIRDLRQQRKCDVRRARWLRQSRSCCGYSAEADAHAILA